MKNIEHEYNRLSDRIANKNCKMVHHTLTHNTSLDVLHEGGKFFILAIDNGDIDIVRLLLNHFEQKQLSIHKEGSLEYLRLKQKIVDVIKRATEDVKLSEDMSAALDKYIPKESSESSLEGFSSLVSKLIGLGITTDNTTSNTSSIDDLNLNKKVDPYDMVSINGTSNTKCIFWDNALFGSHYEGMRYSLEFKTLVINLLRENTVRRTYELLQELDLDRIPSISTLYLWNNERGFTTQENPTLGHLKDLPQMQESHKFDSIVTYRIDLDKNNTVKSQTHQDNKQIQCYEVNLNHSNCYNSTRSNTPPVEDLVDKDIKQNQTIIEEMNQDISSEIIGNNLYDNHII